MTKHRNQPAAASMFYDEIADTLYDREAYAADGKDQVTFFARALGMVDKTYADTNMYLPNQLPQGVKFLVTSIEVIFLPAAGLSKRRRIADINAVARSGCMSFHIQNREYARTAPLASCPAVPYWFHGMSAEDKDSNHRDYVRAQLTEQFRETDYGAFGGVPFLLVPVWIESSQYFNVVVTDRAPLPSGQAGSLYARLRGRRIRPSV